MSVWFVLPSARPPEEAEPVLWEWKQRGYHVALWRDDKRISPGPFADVVIDNPVYPGYAKAVNELIAKLFWMRLKEPMTPEWFVAAGDDTLPDPTKRAQEIARECSERFWGPLERSSLALREGMDYGTFGVMQPTGDRFGISPENPDPAMRSAYIDRVCGSPWMGREFCKRVNQGKGPLWPEYFHMGCDEELQAVATKLGILWQRPDLTQHHQHWGRPREGERMSPSDRMPQFLKRANSGEEWQKYKRLFEERKAAGFPGSEPI